MLLIDWIPLHLRTITLNSILSLYFPQLSVSQYTPEEIYSHCFPYIHSHKNKNNIIVIIIQQNDSINNKTINKTINKDYSGVSCIDE